MMMENQLSVINRWFLWFGHLLGRQYVSLHETDMGITKLVRFHYVGEGLSGPYGWTDCRWAGTKHRIVCKSSKDWVAGDFSGTWENVTVFKPWIKPMEFNLKAKHGRFRQA
jgi:hypothetical protein